MWAVSLSVFDIWCNHYIAFLWFPFPGYFPCWVFLCTIHKMFMGCFSYQFSHLISPIILILIYLSVFPFKRIIRGLSNFPLSEQNFCWFNWRVSNLLTGQGKKIPNISSIFLSFFFCLGRRKNFLGNMQPMGRNLDTPGLIRRKFSVNENWVH